MNEYRPLQERLAAIAAFLPAFERPGFQSGRWLPETAPGQTPPRGAVLRMPWFRQAPEMSAFVAACYANGWVRDLEWATWKQTPEAIALRDDPAVLAGATADQLAHLLTTILRSDRFCEGTLAATVESGLVVGILRRAAALAAESPRG